MKKTLLFLLVSVFIGFSAFAQQPMAGTNNLTKSKKSGPKIEITPMVGYFFGGSIKFYEGKLKVKDNISYGVAVGVPLPSGITIEFNYITMPSTAQWRPYYSYEIRYPERNFGVNVNYFNLGSTRNVPLAENVVGFGALRLGAAYFNSTASDIDDVWRFEASLGAGLKVYVTEKVGLRFSGNFHIPMVFSGGGLFCGIGTGGSGCSVGVGSTSSILQGDLSAGLIFRLGQ